MTAFKMNKHPISEEKNNIYFHGEASSELLDYSFDLSLFLSSVKIRHQATNITESPAYLIYMELSFL